MHAGCTRLSTEARRISAAFVKKQNPQCVAGGGEKSTSGEVIAGAEGRSPPRQYLGANVSLLHIARPSAECIERYRRFHGVCVAASPARALARGL